MDVRQIWGMIEDLNDSIGMYPTLAFIDNVTNLQEYFVHLTCLKLLS